MCCAVSLNGRTDVHRHSGRRRRRRRRRCRRSRPSKSRPCHRSAALRKRGLLDDVCVAFTLRNISHCPIGVEYYIKKKKEERERKKLPSHVREIKSVISTGLHTRSFYIHTTECYARSVSAVGQCAAKRNEIK